MSATAATDPGSLRRQRPEHTLRRQRPEHTLRRQRRRENFPVALRVLPATLRADLIAAYDVVRVIDDLGDEAPGDRTAQLREFAADLALVWATGRPKTPVLQRLVPTAGRRALAREPFERLIRANLADQHVTAYDGWADLMAYCDLSAAPIGSIVLQLFDVATPRREALSARVCAALQVLEHCQDVSEDRRAGRIYLPQQDLRHFGVTPADLDGATTGGPVRRLIGVETGRAGELLDAGRDLVAGLSGWTRLAVAGYIAGGRATVDALRRADYDVLPGPPRPRRRDLARHLAAELRGRS